MAYKSTHGYDYSGTVDDMWNDAVWQKMLKDEGLTIDDMKK
jgi:hypothetical protein